MPVAVNVRRIPIHVFIPPQEHPDYKIEVIRTDSTTDNVTDNVTDFSFIKQATSGVGDFTVTIDNGNEEYSYVWDNGNTVYLYIDYGTPTSKRFTGKIDKISGQHNNIVLKGRHKAGEILEVTVTKDYSNIEASVIFKDLIDTYLSGFTYTNVATSTTNVTIKWSQKPLMDCFKDLCDRAGFDFFADADLDFHFFEAKSVMNTEEAVVHNDNLFETSDFGEDISQVRNRIIVYGQPLENTTLMHTAEDTDSQDTHGLKEMIVSDTNLTTYEQVKERAEAELTIGINPPIIGDLTSFMLPSIEAGELLRISDPANTVAPSAYKVIKVEHKYDGFPQSIVTIEKERVDLSSVMKSRYVSAQEQSDIVNQYEMRYSYNLDFNDDGNTDSHDGTSVSEGFLISSGGSGTFTSASRIATADITQAQIIVTGSGLEGTEYWLSNDNGISYESIDKNELLTFSSTGKQLKIKIKINSATTQLDSLCILYK